MKKSVILGIALLTSMMLCAEKYQIGDFVEKDGVPSIVVYVDQTGEHGLLMSMRARLLAETELPKIDKLNEEKRKSMVYTVDARYKFYHIKRAQEKGIEAIAHLDSMYKVQIEMIDKYLEMPPLIVTKQYQNIKTKQKKQILESIKGSTTGSGEENMKLIFDYCAENGLSVQDYFPQFYWASTIGNDWFIPGNNELELMAQNTCFSEIGFDKGIKLERWKSDRDMFDKLSIVFQKYSYILRNVSIGLDCQFYHQWKIDMLWPLANVASSTMLGSNWSNENYDKIIYQYKISTDELLEWCKKNNNFYVFGMFMYPKDLFYRYYAFTDYYTNGEDTGAYMAMCKF